MKANVSTSNDKELIIGLRNRDPQTLALIYKNFSGGVHKIIRKAGGQLTDAEDVFQEAIIVLYRKANDPSFELTSKLNTYLLGIVKRIWLKRITKKGKAMVSFSESTALRDEKDLDEEIQKHERYNLYQKHFSRLSDDCQKLLSMYLDKVRMSKIAQEMGYKSENYAKKRKFHCKERLITMIKTDSSYHELV